MADENELIHLQQQISQRCGVDPREDDVIVIEGHNLHIPPMLFLQVLCRPNQTRPSASLMCHRTLFLLRKFKRN
jgi:hypothetical protein